MSQITLFWTAASMNIPGVWRRWQPDTRRLQTAYPLWQAEANAAFRQRRAENGAGELYDGIAAYCDGVSELAAGTNKLYTETDGMDTQLQEQIDEILASIGGEETETVSFVSHKTRMSIPFSL